METQHYDYRDLENQTYSTVGRQLDDLSNRAEELGDEQKIEVVKEFRAGLRAAGLGDATKFLEKTQKEGGTVMGQYDNSKDQISMAGLDTFEQAAYQSGKDLKSYTEAVARHELRHREQNQQGNPETYAVIAKFVGKDREKITHILKEADACEFTPDAYQEEQREAARIAGELKMSKATLHQIHRTGDLKQLIQHAADHNQPNYSI